MVNDDRYPSRSASRRRIRTHAEWNVETHIFSATGPTSAPTRVFISSAALLVKVMARISNGLIPWSRIRWAMRCVSTRVLPDPAPATMSSGPSVWVTASAWTGLSPARSGSSDGLMRHPNLLGAYDTRIGSAEVDLGGGDHRGGAIGGRLEGPVEVGVGDHGIHGWRAPLGEVLGGMGVADEGGVVAAGEGAVERRPHARIRLRPRDDQPTHAPGRQLRLERGVLEGVAVALVDDRLTVVHLQLRHVLPLLAALGQLPALVLHPDHGHLGGPRPLDDAVDVGDHLITMGGAVDDAVLDVDDDDRGVGAVRQAGHA